MARRDLPFADSTNLAIVGPLTQDALAQLPGRFAAWAAAAAAARFRFRRSAGRWVPVRAGELAARIERAVVHVPDDLDAAQVEDLVRGLEYSELAVMLILTPSTAAINLSHYFGDGPLALVAIRAILSGEIPGAPRETRFPLVRALLATGQWRPSALRRGRDLLHGMHGHFAAASWSRPGQLTESVALSSVRLDTASLRPAVARERETDPKASTLDVLTSLVLRSFAASLADGADMPVRMLVGLRQHLPEGLSTSGNFSTSAILGSLRGSAWTPAGAREAMAAVTSSPTLVAAEGVEAIAHARARLRGRPVDGGSPLQLTYNVITGRVGADRGDFRPGEPQSAVLLMLNRGPLLGPHCTVTVTGSDYLVTTVDDTGLLDLPRFEDELRAALLPS